MRSDSASRAVARQPVAAKPLRLCFTLALVLCAHPGSAATFTVNSTTDAVDARPGNGVCETATGNGICTLRAAIQAANALSGADTIVIPAGTYTLTIAGRAETAAATGDLDITDSLTITGAGAASTIVQSCAQNGTICVGIDRVFHVDPNGAGITVSISGLTIQNGTGQVIPFVSANGGAILLGVAQTLGSPIPSGRLTLTDCVVANSTTDRDGGGIFNNAGTLTLIRTTVSNSNAGGNGGGIANGDGGVVRLTDSTLSNNHAPQGGAIFSGYFDTGTSTNFAVTNSTINGNTAGQGPGQGFGAGVYANRGVFAIVNSTIAGNTSLYSGGGIYAAITVTLNSSTIAGNVAGTSGAGGFGAGFVGVVTASNTIFAGNTLVGTPSDCGGTLTSGGYNLIQSTAGCALTGTTTGNIIGQDARLAPLANNGGATQTRGLLPGSPAIDAANPAIPGSGGGACTAIDQRGISRPQPAGGRCDIGAVETQGGALSISLVVPNQGGNAGPLVTTIQSDGGFAVGASVKLSRAGQPDIIGGPVTVGGGGALVSTSFDLTGKATGTWDVTVTNPDGTSLTRPGAFTIAAANTPDVWAQLIGPSLIRVDRNVTYTILFGNRGNVEAWAVPLDLGVGDNVTFAYTPAITPPPAQPGQVPTDWSQFPITTPAESDGIVHAQLVLPFIPPGFTGAIQFTILAPLAVHGQGTNIVVGIGLPYYQPNADPQHQTDLIDLAEQNAQSILGTAFPSALVPNLQQYLQTQLQNMVQQSRAAWVASLGAQYPVYGDSQLQVDLFTYAVALASGAR